MQKQKTMITDLTQGNVFILLIRFAAPLILANILQMIYNIVDMIIIGRFVGSAGIAAVANGGEIMMLFTSFSIGFCSAGQIIISQYVGKGDKTSVNRTIGTMISFMILFSLALSVVALLIAEWGLNIINTPVEAFSMAKDYTSVCFVGLVFVFGYNTVSAVLRGMGDGKRPLVFIAVATVVNIVLDVVFVAYLNMEAMGAALATIIGQGVSFLFSLVYLYKRKEAFGFDFKRSSFKIDGSILKMLAKLGLPMALQSMAVGISGLVVTAFVNAYGVVAAAVAGIGAKLRMIIGILTSSLVTAASSMIGQNVGAGRYDRVNQVFIRSFLIMFVFSLILGGIGVLFPETIFGIFDTNPEVLVMAPKFMVINFVTFLSFAGMQPGTSLVNGIGNAGMSFFVGIMDGVVTRIGVIIIVEVVLHLGVWGIWWGSTLSAFSTVLITLVYYLSGKWKTYKPIINK